MNRKSFNRSGYLVNKRSQRRLNTLIDDLLNDYSKLLVLRLYFYTLKDYELVNTYDYLNEAFERLRNNLRYNKRFEHYITYAVSIE